MMLMMMMIIMMMMVMMILMIMFMVIMMMIMMIMNLFSSVIGILVDQDVDVPAARVDDVILDDNHFDILSFKVGNMKKI